MRRLRAFLLLSLLCIQMGCGSTNGSKNSPPPVVSVSVSAASSDVRLGAKDQMTPNVTGSSNQNVSWFVNGVANGNSSIGTISSSGLYTAPAVMASPNSDNQSRERG